MHAHRTLVALTSTAILGLTLAACGGGGGGGGGGQSPQGSTGPLAGAWHVSTTFTPDGALAGACPAGGIGPLALDFDFCKACESEPDSCLGLCDVYLITSPSIARGGLGAVVNENPPLPDFELILVGDYYDASLDLTIDFTFGFPGSSGFLTETGWEASVECTLYAGDVLVPDPDDPGGLRIDPDATPVCVGTLVMIGSRGEPSAALARAADEPPLRFAGRFLPRGAAPRAMRLERGSRELWIVLARGGTEEEELHLRTPLAASGRFGLVLEDDQGSLALEGLLDGELAVGKLVLERDGRRLEGRFALAAE